MREYGGSFSSPTIVIASRGCMLADGLGRDHARRPGPEDDVVHGHTGDEPPLAGCAPLGGTALPLGAIYNPRRLRVSGLTVPSAFQPRTS